MKDNIVALDLGASKVKLCVNELGYILCEPSFVVLDNKKIFGKDAYEKIAEFSSYSKIIDNLEIQNKQDFEDYISYLTNKCEIQGYIKNVFIATNNASNVKQFANIEDSLIKVKAIS